MPSKYEQRIQNYLAAHPGATRAEARGHKQTPEHGRILPAQKVQHFAGRTVNSTYSDTRVEAIVNKAADGDARVSIKVHVAGEGWRTIGGARGYSAGFVAGEQATQGGIRAAIFGLPGAGGGKGTDSDGIYDIGEDDIDAWQVDVLE